MPRHLTYACAVALCLVLQSAAAGEPSGRIRIGVSCSWPFGCILICDATAIQMNPNSFARVEKRDDGQVTITIYSDGGISKRFDSLGRGVEPAHTPQRSFSLKTRSACVVKNLDPPQSKPKG